jgi:hypothetical protein
VEKGDIYILFSFLIFVDSVVLDGRVFVYLFFKQSIRELYSSLVGGSNATFWMKNKNIEGWF